MPSDTPLTDANVITNKTSVLGPEVRVYTNGQLHCQTEETVPAEFARKLEIYNTQLARQVADDERWIKEVLTDFGIPFDDHRVGRRIALTQWMAEQRRGD